MDGYTITGIVILFLLWLYIFYRLAVLINRLIKRLKGKKKKE